MRHERALSSGVFADTDVPERCASCANVAIGAVNGTPFCENESCIEAAIKVHAEPITAALGRLQTARAMRAAR